MANEDDDVEEVRTVKTEPAVSIGGIALLTVAFALSLVLVVWLAAHAGGG
ncbi:MAG: hypothetical protein AB7J30_01940 [Hyphomicrobium sp.]